MIGVFDSGIGGLSVLAALRSAYPAADLLYYADTANLPYGGRSPALIRRFAKEAGKRFGGWGADCVQVACGTVSSLALDDFAAAAGCPVSGVVLPVVDTISRDGRRRVLILSTEATARSRVFDAALTAKRPGVATLSLILPSFLIVLAIVRFYTKFRSNSLFDGVMSWLRPCVAGLIGAAAIILVIKTTWGPDGMTVRLVEENFPDWKSWILLAGAFAASYWGKVNPILVILCGGLLGLLLY